MILNTILLLSNLVESALAVLRGQSYKLSLLLFSVTFGPMLIFIATLRLASSENTTYHERLVSNVTLGITIGALAALNLSAMDPLKLITTLMLRRRRNDEHSDASVDPTFVDSSNSKPRDIIFVDGTSGLGKTTICHRSLDFTHYLATYPMYINKSNMAHLQVLYDFHIMIDTVTELMNAKDQHNGAGCYVQNKNPILLDRSFLSQIAYAILFQNFGHIDEPRKFAERVRPLFENPNFRLTMRQVTERWFDLFRRLVGPECSVGIQWFVAADTRYTMESMLARNGFDVKMPNIVLEHYIENQNTVFERLYRICKLGTLTSVYHICESDISLHKSTKNINELL